MQILKIKSFIAVVVSESFSDAAEMLYTTQASVSKHVLSLERELGVTLFDRSKRKVKLTESGHIFLHYAQILMSAELLFGVLGLAVSRFLFRRFPTLPHARVTFQKAFQIAAVAIAILSIGIATAIAAVPAVRATVLTLLINMVIANYHFFLGEYITNTI